MAGTNTNGLIDPDSGFCLRTKALRRLRPKMPLPPPSQFLSVTQFTLSLLPRHNISDQRLTFHQARAELEQLLQCCCCDSVSICDGRPNKKIRRVGYINSIPKIPYRGDLEERAH